VNVPFLADAVDTAKALLQSRRVPGKVVIDHQPAELQVDAFARRLGGNADLLLGAELLLCTLALVRVHAAVDLAGGVGPAGERLAHVVECVTVFGENQQLAPAAGKFLERGPFQARFQCGQFRV